MMDPRLTNDMLDEMMGYEIPKSVIVGYVISALAGVLGCFIGSYAGWWYSEGLAPIVGGGVGFALLFTVSLAATGPLKYHYEQFLTHYAPPEMSRLTSTGLQKFDLYVIVHDVRNIKVPGLFEVPQQFYVEAKVGRLVNGGRAFNVQLNPPNRTCVQATGEFEECFRFTVTPTDDTIKIVLKEQDVLFDDTYGWCYIDINSGVIGQGFPQKRAYRLHSKADSTSITDTGSSAGSIVLSFAPGADFPKSAMLGVQAKSRLAVDSMRSAQAQWKTKAQQENGAYGTFTTTQQLV